MSTSALDKRFAQGRYSFEVVGCDVSTSIQDGAPLASVRTELVLSVEQRQPFPKLQGQPISVRIAGPAMEFDRTKDGAAIVGAVRISAEFVEVLIVGTETFLSHAMFALRVVPNSHCFLTVTTESRLDDLTAGEHSFILDAAIMSKTQ